MKKTIILIALILAAMSVQAQGGPEGSMPPPNMDAVRIWKLTEALELTEEQTVTFLPLIQIHERKLRDLQHEIFELGRQGQEMLEAGEVSQKDVDKILKEYTNKQNEILSIKQDFIKTLPKYLTPQQQVLYLGFEARFRKELKEFMKDRHGSSGRSRKADRR